MSEVEPGTPTSLQWSEQWAGFSDHFIRTLEPTLSPRSPNELNFQLNHSHTVEDPQEDVPQENVRVSLPNSGSISDPSEYAQGYTHLEANVDDPQKSEMVHFRSRYEPGKTTRKTCRDRNWTEEETSVLVDCKRLAFYNKASPFRRQCAINWEAISKKLRSNPNTRASEKTGDQCRLRWDTLVKSHRQIKQRCTETRKGFAELTAKEMGGLKLATTLKEEWFEVIDSISRKTRSPKRDNPPTSYGVANPEIVQLPSTSRVPPDDTPAHRLPVEGTPPASTRNPPPGITSAQLSKARPDPWNFSPKQIAIPGFSSLDGHLKSTLLDLIIGTLLLRDRWFDVNDRDGQSLSFCCQWLSVVQNRSCSETYDDVIVLVKMELVHIFSLYGVLSIDGSRFRVFDNFVKNVIRNNPKYGIHKELKLLDDRKFLSGREFSASQQIRVLKLDRCRGLESVDFRGFRKLRVLFVYRCLVLKEVTGWKFLRELGWLEIDCCTSYHDYPDLLNLPSLKEFRLNRYYISDCPPRADLGMSQCVRLRRLEIWEDNLLEGSGDLSSLKCLEILSFYECCALSTITGLSGLHSLTSLSVAYCLALRILPDLSHMKELAGIDIRRTNLEEIRGVADLVSLKTLDCRHSKLKHLPDLHHLPSVQKVWLADTPLIEDDPSSFYFDKPEVLFHYEEKGRVDVSDISDTEHNLSDSSGI